MAWPNPNEYVEAIQHPEQAFSDPDLRGGSVVTNRLGLPRPISGNFATVFEVEADDQRWAVRCFLREVTNQQERYAAISAHLKQYALPCMVNFEYLPEGIMVRGKWYPILKMDWTAGIRLDTYIERHLDDTKHLRQLAERWISLCRSLHEAQIAHGDLQHGNILVTDQHDIKLIDYDGMIIPEVIGLSNAEIGHRHYQHPTRTNGNGITLERFENIDNFSCYVIGLSLLALSVDSSLWGKTQAGEENLLFRDTDYQAPETSNTFDLLDTHEDQRVRAVGQMMLEAVQAPFYLDVPAFNRNPIDHRWSWVKSWLMNRVNPVMPLLPTITEENTRASWVFDHVETKAAPLDFTDDFILHERIALEVEFEQSILRPVARLLLPFAVARLVMRYPRYPLVLEKSHAGYVCHSLEKQLGDAKSRRKTLSRLIVEAEQRYQQDVRAFETNIAQLQSDLNYSQRQETREVMRLERTVQSLTTELAQQRLQPGRVLGIGEAQIEALAQASIYSAAEITPANEAAALHALNGVANAAPRDDWEALIQWRGALEQQLMATPISPDDVRQVREHHAQVQQQLAEQQDEAERQLADIKADSDHLRLAQNLRSELDLAEAEVNALQQQSSKAETNLSRYELITLRRLLSKMLDWPSLR